MQVIRKTGLVTLLIYKVLKLYSVTDLTHRRLVTLLIYKVLKLVNVDTPSDASLFTLLIYKVLKQDQHHR